MPRIHSSTWARLIRRGGPGRGTGTGSARHARTRPGARLPSQENAQCGPARHSPQGLIYALPSSLFSAVPSASETRPIWAVGRARSESSAYLDQIE